MLYDSEKREITVALTGDAMLTRRLSVFIEDRFLKLRELLRTSDVAFANFETSARDYDEGSPTISGGTFMTTEPRLLEDLKWFGINVVSCANNHAFDYGEEGILANICHLDEYSILHAGTGRNLREARSPAYLDTPQGRVAVISVTSFFSEWSQAGEQRPDFRGRPGVNPLGFKTFYTLDHQAMAELRRMGKALGLAAENERRRNFGFSSPSEVGIHGEREYSFLGQRFQAGESFVTETKAEERDVAENLAQLHEAKRQADWVVVSLHYHQMGGAAFLTARSRTELEECAGFVRDFARRCIDEGADVVVGHGPHMLLGIELYRQKPIFYSLGNIILQNETVRFLPSQPYSRFGLGHDATPADFLDIRSDSDTKAHPAHPVFWETVCAVCKFTSGELKQVLLYPVDLGYGRPRAQRGRPLLADAKTGEKIITRLQRLSRAFDTEIAYKEGRGIIEGV